MQDAIAHVVFKWSKSETSSSSPVLAGIKVASPIRVGKYGVDVTCLDNIGVPAIVSAVNNQWLVVIDEIGPMELKSNKFRQTVAEVFNRDLVILASIVKRCIPFTDALKHRSDVNLFEVRHNNMDHILEKVLQLL